MRPGNNCRILPLYNAGTVLRTAACAFLFWAFSMGSVLFPLRPQTVAAVAAMLSILVGLELLLRNAPHGWILAGMLLVDAAVGGSYLLWRHLQPPAPTGPLMAAHDPSPPALCGEITAE
jgi:hypothetical protein